jgi:hypothetical protein
MVDVSSMSFFREIHREHKFHPSGSNYITSDKFQKICHARFDKNIKNERNRDFKENLHLQEQNRYVSFYFCALLKSSFAYIRLFSAAAWRMTPTLPQGGKQSKGSNPLTPSFFGIYFNLVRSYRNKGDARAAGAEA